MDFSSLLLFAGAAVVAFFSGKLLVKGDNLVEDKKRTAIRLASWTQANGLPELSQLLTSFAINDVSGVFTHFRAIADTLSDADTSRAVVDKFLQVQLQKKIATSEGQEELIRFVEKAMGLVIDRDSIKKQPIVITKEVVDVEDDLA